MSDIAVRIESLGKSYFIQPAAQNGSGYMTLREDLMVVPRLLMSKFKGSAETHTNIWALKDISLEIEEGEVLGIIGRNGAGKSTLLKILSHITEPTRGRVELFGRVGSLLEVGTGFHPELTGRENIYLNGTILGMRRAEVAREFDGIVDFAEIGQFIDMPIKFYSSGMYLRLAFAVAAHLETEILLVDEVLAVGDAEFQKKCLGKVKEVGQSGRTVLFVSHNMTAIEQLCSRALLLDNGHVKQLSRDVRSVIREHLFGRESEADDNAWRNSGLEFNNPWFKPLRFCITDEYGQKRAMSVANDSEIWIQIEGEIGLVDPALTVGYALYSEDGILLYWSYQTDESPDKWPVLRRGRCILRSQIPKRLLNQGIYRVEMIGSLHYRQWLFEAGVNSPSLYFTIQGGLSDSPLWMAKRYGLLAPVIRWFIQYEAS